MKILNKTETARYEGHSKRPDRIDRINAIANSGMISPSRKIQLIGFIADGFHNAIEVSNVTRNSLLIRQIAANEKHLYCVEVRGATSGKWGKSCEIRAVRV